MTEMNRNIMKSILRIFPKVVVLAEDHTLVAVIVARYLMTIRPVGYGTV